MRHALRFAPAVFAALLALAAPAFAQTKPPTTWNPAYSGNYQVAWGRSIRYVVIHTIEGSYAGGISWFKDPSSNVSAHYIVSYGGAITQMVADKDIAWHVGQLNSQSIGIEHEGWAYRNYWTDAEYRASAALTRWLCLAYAIPMDRTHIIGHVEAPGATHTDPGPYFNWSYYMSLVRGGSAPPSSTLKAVQVTTDTLNVRSGPSTSYGIIGAVYSGQRYVSIATSGSWHRIYYANNTGWCSGGYLSTVSGVTGLLINTASLNVRSGPSTAYAIVGSVSQGQRYVRISTSGSWARIWWRGGAYWVHGDYASTFGL